MEKHMEILISFPLDKHETCLPSPEKLKKRIILKHKKLPEGVDENVARLPIASSISVPGDLQAGGGDIASSVKNGILYVHEDGEWVPHFFVLTQTNMYYSEVRQNNEQDEDELETTSLARGQASNDQKQLIGNPAAHPGAFIEFRCSLQERDGTT